VLPVAEGPQERLLGDVLGRQPAPGEGVGQLHHRVVFAEVEGLEPLRFRQPAQVFGRINRVDPRDRCIGAYASMLTVARMSSFSRARGSEMIR
jgi:hypothetical protein